MRITNIALLGMACLIAVGPLTYAETPTGEEKPVSGNESIVLLAQQTLLRLLQEEDFERALPVAEGIVRTLDADRVDPGELVGPLDSLGIVQLRVGDGVAAEASFERSIGIVEDIGGEFSPDLVRILRHMGMLYYAQRRLDEAEQMFRRAQHITHREGGIYSLDQLKLVDSIAVIKARMGNLKDADREHRFHYQISAENYGEDDPRMLPAMTRLGNWYRVSGQFDSAKEMFLSSIERMRSAPDHSRRAEIAPLKEVSRILYLQGHCCAEEPLAEIVDIVSISPGADAEERLDAALELADMTLVKGDPALAIPLYHDAWDLMAPDGGDETRAQERFAHPAALGIGHTEDVVHAFRRALSRRSRSLVAAPEVLRPNRSESTVTSFKYGAAVRERSRLIGSPVPLCYPDVFDLVKTKSRGDLADYYMDLEFSVSSHGEVEELEVVDSNTPRRLARYVVNMLRKIRFRPRMEDGEAVDTARVGWKQTFKSVKDLAEGQPTRQVSSAAVFHGCRQLALGY